MKVLGNFIIQPGHNMERTSSSIKEAEEGAEDRIKGERTRKRIRRGGKPG
jgi:hypothetical protein